MMRTPAAVLALALVAALAAPATAQFPLPPGVIPPAGTCPPWASAVCGEITKLCALTTDATRCLGCLMNARTSNPSQAGVAALACMGCSILPGEAGTICNQCITESGPSSGCSLCVRAALMGTNLRIPVPRNPRLPTPENIAKAAECFACAGAVTIPEIRKSSACTLCSAPRITDPLGCGGCVKTARTASQAMACAATFRLRGR